MTALRSLAAAVLGASLLAAAGCQTLVSEVLDPIQTSSAGRTPGAGGACRYQAGAYALPKDLLELRIYKVFGSNGELKSYDTETGTRRTADPRRIYCLDFLGSALSNDQIAIQRSTDTDTGGSSLLLAQIGSTFADQSLVIADKLVDAVAEAAAARSGFNYGGGTKVLVADYAFDPFDRQAIIRVNEALRALDHCVYLDPSNDPHVPAWHLNLCDRDGAGPTKSEAFYSASSLVSTEPPPAAEALRGVLYRPLLTHKLVVLRRNPDPVGLRWRVFETKRVQMTTAAPAFLLEVKRSAFIKRTMNVTFDRGVLATVDINKPSEAEELSRFVLRTAQVIVSIPIRAIALGTSEAENRKQLILAQSKLIQAVRDYQAEVRTTAGESAGQGGAASGARAAPGDFARSSGAESELDACVRALPEDVEDKAEQCVQLVRDGRAF